MDTWFGVQLYNGRIHSHPVGGCGNHAAGSTHPGAPAALERVMHEPPDHPGGGYGVHKLKLRRLNNNLKSINTMKPNAYIGIILIILAVISFAYQGITYQTREKAVDLGPLQVTAERTHTIPLPPILGFIALAGGVVLLVTSNKQT